MKTIQIVAGQEIRALLRSKGIMITMTAQPAVACLKWAMSCGKCQGSVSSRPMMRRRACAQIRPRRTGLT